LIPVGNGIGALGVEWQKRADRFSESVEARRAHFRITAFRDDVGALPITTRLQHNEDLPSDEAALRFFGVSWEPWQAEPHHVDRRAEVLAHEAGRAPQNR